MKRNYSLTMITAALLAVACNNIPGPGPSGTTTFQKMFGGSNIQEATSAQQTSDGGYIVAGSSNSTDINGVTNNGGYDAYVIKLDSNGNVVWQNMYGGSGSDSANCIQQTSDGGYIVAGTSNSADFAGGVLPNSTGAYVIKLDSKGNIVWQRIYEGLLDATSSTSANSIRQTRDGGYIVAGGIVVSDGHEIDVYVMKLDNLGNVEWQNNYGGAIAGYTADSIQQTSDGGYIVAGVGVAIKLDNLGNVEWQNGQGSNSIQQTSDGGYIVAGDPNVVNKLDSSGKVVWQKSYERVSLKSILQTNDGGYIVAGALTSTVKSPYDASRQGSDLYILKLDSSGTVVWTKTYGGTWTNSYLHINPLSGAIYFGADPSYDCALSIQQTSDGGYIVAGLSNSADISGVTLHSTYLPIVSAGYSTGTDVYVLRLNSDGDL